MDQGSVWANAVVYNEAIGPASPGHYRMALLIEVDQTAAERLYERLGLCTDYPQRIAGSNSFTWFEICDAPRRLGRASKRGEFPGAGQYRRHQPWFQRARTIPRSL